jgi:hypothetical protein
MGLVLVTLLAGVAFAEPPAPSPVPDKPVEGSRPSVCGNPAPQALQGYKAPGRKPDSQVPWELFLGNASHRLIAYIYGTRYPTNTVFYNNTPIKRILDRTGLGDPSLLPEIERELRPDITDASARVIFEIKPQGENGLQEGIRELQTYLLALNRTLTPDTGFLAGKDFDGEILIQFAQGQYIWRLEWCTTPPGVTQYRWTRSQERSNSNTAAYQAGQWVDISEQELKQYGGWVAQAVTGMVDRRERLTTLSNVVGVAIDVLGQVAIAIISTATPDRRGASRQGGTVLPFPSKPSPTAPPGQLPKASGM